MEEATQQTQILTATKILTVIKMEVRAQQLISPQRARILKWEYPRY
jgi:hypothetical protein